MGRSERMDLVKRIEDATESRLITVIHGDRRGLETRIATDMFPMIQRELVQINHRPRLNLFLYGPGGITVAGFGLVNLIREFCDEFNVIVPFKAMSAATLIALGADSIIMSPMGQLSPIDPSLEHPLGPEFELPGSASLRVPVNVEDVNAFLDLARDEFGLSGEDALTIVFSELAEVVHPLVLGAVQRSRQEIAFFARKLLQHHLHDEEKIEQIVRTLSRERFSHSYIIGRKEAEEDLMLNVEKPDPEKLALIVDLFEEYSDLLKLNEPYNPEVVLGKSRDGQFQFDRAIIETRFNTYVFRSIVHLSRIENKNAEPSVARFHYPEIVQHEAWVLDNGV